MKIFLYFLFFTISKLYYISFPSKSVLFRHYSTNLASRTKNVFISAALRNYDRAYTLTHNKNTAISSCKLYRQFRRRSRHTVSRCVLFHIKGFSHILLAFYFFHIYAYERSLSYRSVDEFHSSLDKIRRQFIYELLEYPSSFCIVFNK